MIILDTNVISETSKPEPTAEVVDYLNSLDPTLTYLTSINVAELLYGLDILPDGKKKRSLEDKTFVIIRDLFKDRILPFDTSAAARYAELASAAKKSGIAVSMADAMIAAIAKEHGADVATRDEAPFLALGARVVNPWTEAAK